MWTRTEAVIMGSGLQADLHQTFTHMAVRAKNRFHGGRFSRLPLVKNQTLAIAECVGTRGFAMHGGDAQVDRIHGSNQRSVTQSVFERITKTTLGRVSLGRRGIVGYKELDGIGHFGVEGTML